MMHLTSRPKCRKLKQQLWFKCFWLKSMNRKFTESYLLIYCS